MKVEPLACPSKEMVVVTDVSIQYDDHIVNKPISFQVAQGDRIVIDGKMEAEKVVF